MTDSRITDCRIENIGLEAEYGGGIRLAWGSVRNQVIGNVIHNTGRGGIFGDHSAELIIRNNRVSGSGGEGLGIEIWGGCPRSLIEDNVLDHWLSVDGGHQSAVRRNVIGTDDGTLKGYGIEIIARDVVVTDNVVKRGAAHRPVGLEPAREEQRLLGLQHGPRLRAVGSPAPGRNRRHRPPLFLPLRLREYGPWPRHRPVIPRTAATASAPTAPAGDWSSRIASSATTAAAGSSLAARRSIALDVPALQITGNGQAAVTGPSQYTALEFSGCKVEGNKDDRLPAAKPFSSPPPVADFRLSEPVRAGEPVQFQCNSRAAGGIVERLWDFGDGIPEVTDQPKHTFLQPGKYRVTLVVWDKSGRGGRAEKMIQVLPGK